MVSVKFREIIFISGVQWSWEWKGVLCSCCAGQFYDSNSCRTGQVKAGLHMILLAPQICAVYALTKAVDAQTSSLAAPPSLDFLPLVTSICSLCWCQQQQGALGQRMPHWKAVVVGFMLFNPFQSWSHLLFNAAAVSHGAKRVVMLNVSGGKTEILTKMKANK